jgi:alginate O-acetyltransferase complex protein AlgI
MAAKQALGAESFGPVRCTCPAPTSVAGASPGGYNEPVRALPRLRMNFHSLDYFLFLFLVLSGYWLVGRSALRFTLLLFSSCVFYMAWNPGYLIFVLLSIFVDYMAARGMESAPDRKGRRAWLALSLTTNLGLLGIFKYFNFFAGSVGDVLHLFGFNATPPHLDVLLPIGISFYTFESLSYTIDVYRGRIPATKSFVRFACFITFFPHLVAGPIVRAADLLPQFDKPPRLTPRDVGEGTFLIAIGLIKKIVFADYLAVNLIDRVFDDPSAYSSLEVMISLYAYTLQIFCDFSGYTDVARGSGLLFGLRLPENFDRPYQAKSPAEFWRRWHMTLSTWLRDYLYFPLGGSKVPPARAYFNLFLTVALVGLWHGAAWTFVLYGLLHASAMVVHRFFYRRAGRSADARDSLPMHILKIFGTLHFVVLSRIFFRASSLGNAGEVMSQLAEGTTGLFHVTHWVWVLLLAGYAAHFTPTGLFNGIKQGFVRLPAPAQGAVLAGVACALMLVATEDVVPYIYFQF